MKSRINFCCSLLVAVLLSMTAMLNCALAEPVQAQEDARSYIELSTKYPATVIKAGDSMNFDLDIDNESGASQDIVLSIEEIPEGWTGSLSASGRQVSVVHVKNEDINSDVDLSLDVPMETEDGNYTIVLKASADGIEDTMELHLTVNSEEIGESSFSVEYPSQEGDASTAFSYSATLINNTLSDQSYSLTANAPAGWTVSFTPSGETTKVAALDVSARSTQGVDISITPPSDIEAGTYDINCSATSASEKIPLDLSITITGQYSLDLSTPSGRLSLDAYANKESAVQLSLVNTGNSDLTNVNLNSSAPTGWTVRFESETIELIEAGATVETTAYITPGEDAMSGDYVTTITARNSDCSDSAEFRVTVKTETKWGFAGIAIIAVLAAVVGLVMRKYGRR